MKTIVMKFFLVAVSMTLLAGCMKEPDHSIRIRNNYAYGMSEVKVNYTSYGAVSSGKASSYKPVKEGSFTVSGSSVLNETLSGSGSVTGNGTHKWTLSISASGTISIAEDKK